MIDHFCHPNTQMQELETVQEKWYFSCITCTHSSWSLIFNCYIFEVNCTLPTQLQLDFALSPPCPHPLMLHYCTWLSRLPHSSGHHIPVDSMLLHHCLKRCSATAGEAKGTQKYLGELCKLMAPRQCRLIIHPEEVMKNKIAPKPLSKLSTAFPH